jgi:hypothetical protein
MASLAAAREGRCVPKLSRDLDGQRRNPGTLTQPTPPGPREHRGRFAVWRLCRTPRRPGANALKLSSHDVRSFCGGMVVSCVVLLMRVCRCVSCSDEGMEGRLAAGNGYAAAQPGRPPFAELPRPLGLRHAQATRTDLPGQSRVHFPPSHAHAFPHTHMHTHHRTRTRTTAYN